MGAVQEFILALAVIRPPPQGLGAAPYDLRDLGFELVRIETAKGKAACAEAQRGFVERGAPLRVRLVEECARLLRPQA
ncbi:hypothetical protein RB608_02020 [Nocardioides sp. LHD-245]|uniref:hypothetical protein n=1 Tax=Nocardioides sp. LHD-245 TaxID=3051387 RepID=UPI0027E0EB6D|nr:hypothetical protein [Nocardioides sp. LHD-245]